MAMMMPTEELTLLADDRGVSLSVTANCLCLQTCAAGSVMRLIPLLTPENDDGGIVTAAAGQSDACAGQRDLHTLRMTSALARLSAVPVAASNENATFDDCSTLPPTLTKKIAHTHTYDDSSTHTSTDWNPSSSASRSYSNCCGSDDIPTPKDSQSQTAISSQPEDGHAHTSTRITCFG